MKASNAPVQITAVRGTEMRVPGKAVQTSWLLNSLLTKASPRPLPPSEPSPMRRNSAVPS